MNITRHSAPPRGSLFQDNKARRPEAPHLSLGETVGFLYTFLRRRRRLSAPRPTRAEPKIANDAGSGTTCDLEARVKLSGPSFAKLMVVSAASVTQLAKLTPHAALTAAASVASRTRVNPTPPLPRLTPVLPKNRESDAVPVQLDPQPPSTEITSLLLAL